MSSGELNNKIIYDVIGRITQDGYNSASTHMLPVDCVLIGLAGQGKTRGTAAINKVPLCTNQSIGAILPCNTVNPHYLYHFIDNHYLNLRALSSGDGGRGGLSKTLLLNFKIILPLHISEQERIAEALSDVEALIKELDALIGKKRMVLKATMQDLLTARRRLPGFSEPWQEVKLGEIAKISKGQSLQSCDFINGPYPVIAGGMSPQGYHKYYNREENTITISASGANAGYVALWKSNIFATDCSTIETVDRYVIEFMYFALKNIQIIIYKSQIGGAQPHIYPKELNKLHILFTEDISEQRAIAEILSDMDAEIAELEKKKEKYTSIRQGMMQQLLTGKIRLI